MPFLLLCMQLATAAGTGAERILFSDSFDGGAGTWAVADGEWTATDGAYVSSGAGLSVAAGQEWTSYAVEVRLRTGKPGANSWEVAGFAFQFTARDNRFHGDYYYVLLHQQKNLELGKRVGGKQVRGGLAHVREVPGAGQWNTLRAEVRGGFIRVFVNGELEIEVNDVEPLVGGTVALMNLGAKQCRFDSVKVTTLAPIEHRVVDDWIGSRYSIIAEHGAAGRSADAAETWSTYRGDNARSGVSLTTLQTPLHLHWTHVPMHPPRPAWPEPGKELHRMPFDYAPQVAVAHGLVFFGSSADHKVHALDLATGQERWSVFTEGAVRFAPVVSGDRLLVASDDGWLYCLSCSDGELLWRCRGGPRDERLLANGQMASRWPARAGVLVDGDTAYFAAGMWSTGGVFVYALRVRDGSVIWRNDTCGRIYMKLPHDYLEGIAGVSPQGYMLLCRDTLVVPNGRAMPAGFDPETGALRFCRNDASKLHHPGGSWNVAAGDLIFGERHPLHRDRHVEVRESEPVDGDGLIAWTHDTGEQVLAVPGKHRAVISGSTMYAAGNGKLTAVDLKQLMSKAGAYYATGNVDPALPKEQVHPLGWWRGTRYPWYPSKVVPVSAQPALWETPVERVYALMLAGGTLLAGGAGEVSAVDAASGRALWSAPVQGQARGLAVAGPRLIVSTTTGAILCFGSSAGDAREWKRERELPSVPPDIKAQATRILTLSKVTSGYCLLLGIGDGMLAYELARQSDLTIYSIESDPGKVTAARQLLDRAGVYGVRVAVHHSTEKTLPYPDYFANLAVAAPGIVPGANRYSQAELYRVLRPCGGVAYVGLEGGNATRPDWSGVLAADFDQMRVRDGVTVLIRGALRGAGEWTHPYADAGRSVASTDEHVRLPLKMLWFGGPGPARMVSRHWRSPVPLWANGRAFIAGEHHVIALDAYNGRELWSRELKGVGHFPAKYRGGGIAADTDHVYAAVGPQCLRLAADTGTTVTTYGIPDAVTDLPVPENPFTTARGGTSKAEPVANQLAWEYLAVTDRLVLGSVGVPNLSMSWWPEAYPEGAAVFGLDKAAGTTRWLYRAEHAVSPESIAVDNDAIYLIDRPGKAPLARAERRGEALPTQATIKALSLTDGRTVWSDTIAAGLQTLSVKSGLLVASGGRRCSVFAASSGETLWQADIVRGVMPVIIGDTLYAYPQAYDLRTGRPREVVHPLTGRDVSWNMEHKGGCGAVSGCPGALFFRSGASGMVDLATDSGLQWLGQVRPSCWINMIPAGGTLLFPEGASNCSCPYNYQTSLAMIPDSRHESWSVFPQRQGARGELIRRISLNFGAVGDKRDADRALWLAYPRPFRPGALDVPLVTLSSAERFRKDADLVPIGTTQTPWLYTSGFRAPLKLELDLRLQRPVLALACAAAPAIDGRLDDACWDGSAPLTFTTDEQVADARSIAYLRCDAEALYLAFRRQAAEVDGKPVPWTMRTTGRDAPVWKDDSLNLRLRKGTRRQGLYLSVSASGATFDGDKKGRKIGADKAWNGEWASAVHTTPAEWSVEVSVPWTTLAEAGIARDELAIYLESANRSGVGPERTQFKTRPYTRLWCFAHPFTPVVFEPLPEAGQRRFRAVLHFAEPDDLQPGQRVFDVKLQGQTVLESLDIIAQAGARDTALVTEVGGILARDTLTLELVPRTGVPPVISALELHEEREGGD